MKRKALKLLALVSLFLAGCAEETPVSHIYNIPRYTTDEIAERVLNHDYIMKGDIELYYKQDGAWCFYGTFPLVSIYIEPDNEWRDIVVFDNGYIIHFVEDESLGNFRHYVLYDGKKLYF